MECDPPLGEEGGAKRRSAQKLIERYYYQLTTGCGQSCGNPHCASNSTPVAPNEAAAKALHLFKIRAPLCQRREEESMEVTEVAAAITTAEPSTSASLCSGPRSKAMAVLNEARLEEIISNCERSGDWAPLKQSLWEVFSTPDCLGASWAQTSSPPLNPTAPNAPKASADLRKMTKEELRALEGEKDVDSLEEVEKKKDTGSEKEQMASTKCTVDITSLRRSYDRLFALDNSIFEAGLVNALVMLCSNLEMDLKCKPNIAKDINFLNLYEIVLELPVIGYEAYLENVVPLVCRGVALLPVESQAALVRSWSQHSPDKLKSMLENLQQILSLKVYTGTFTRDHLMNDDETIAGAVSVIRIIYYASLLGGATTRRPDWDTAELPTMDTDTFSSIEMVGNASRKRYHDEISEQLQLSPLDVRVPLIQLEEFYNEPLNETIEMDRDFANWKMPGQDYTEKP